MHITSLSVSSSRPGSSPNYVLHSAVQIRFCFIAQFSNLRSYSICVDTPMCVCACVRACVCVRVRSMLKVWLKICVYVFVKENKIKQRERKRGKKEGK